MVAHRGASLIEPENTIAAFEAAIAVGADAVEFDVRMTADGIPIVMHDADVTRTTDGTGLVRDLDLSDVRRLRIGLPRGGSARVPTLDEALVCLSGRLAVDVEIKNVPGEPDFDPEREEAVEATLAALDRTGFLGDVLISSFNPFSIARSRQLAPTVETGLLTNRDVGARAALTFARRQGHRWVLPHVAQVLSAGEDFVASAHAEGAAVGTWVVDDPATALVLIRTGVDAIATNDPGSIVAVRETELA